MTVTRACMGVCACAPVSVYVCPMYVWPMCQQQPSFFTVYLHQMDSRAIANRMLTVCHVDRNFCSGIYDSSHAFAWETEGKVCHWKDVGDILSILERLLLSIICEQQLVSTVRQGHSSPGS